MNDLQMLLDFKNACILAGMDTSPKGAAAWQEARDRQLVVEERLKELAARADAWEAFSGEAHALRLENADLRENFRKSLGAECVQLNVELAEAHNAVKVLLAACELALPEVELKQTVAANVDDLISPDLRRLWRVTLALTKAIKIGKDVG
jgi:hypothetical protein